MANFNQIFIIYNPNSTGDSKRNAQDLKNELSKSAQRSITLLPTKHAGHAEKLARNIARKHRQPLIISSSGDGGYNEVINGFMKASNPNAICAVMPSGNANDHSRTMHNKPLAKLIKAGKITSIDLLKITVEGKQKTIRYAHSYAGIGLTPVVAVQLNKYKLNALKEAWLVVKTFYKYRPFTIEVGARKMQLNSLLFANINEMAKVLKLAKSNKPDDGKFEIIMFPKGKKRDLLKRLATAATAGLDTARREKTYSFKTLKKMPMQLDGEVIKLSPHSEVKIESMHKVLRTLV